MRPICRLVRLVPLVTGSAAFALLALASLPAHAQTQALDFTGGQRSVGSSGTLGWTFNLSTTINVTQLGFFDAGNDGLSNSHQVGLWDSSRTLLTSGTLASGLSGTPVISASGLGSFRYVDVTNVVLTPGTYTLGATYLNADVDLLIFQASSRTLASGLTFGSSAASAERSSSSLFFPSPGSFGNSYFGPNLRFTAVTVPPTAAPEPGSLALLLPLVGGVGLVAVRRRRKN